MYCKCIACVCICKKMSSSALVVFQIRNEVVFYLHWQTTRRMGQSHWIAKDVENYLFRTTISVYQLSIFAAVSDLSDEYSACQARTGRPVLAGQFDPLFKPAKLLIMTPTPSIEIPAQHIFKAKVQRTSGKALDWKKSLLMQDSWLLLKSDSTKDTEEFSQFTEPVACREYSLPRDEDSSEPKGWIRGNTTVGPVLEVSTSYLQGKCGVEIRIESVNKDNSHSWVRISHGLNELVTNLNNKDQDDN